MGDILAFAEQRAGQLRAAANEVLCAAAGAAAELGGSAHGCAQHITLMFEGEQ